MLVIHSVFGLQWNEISSIVVIVATLCTFIGWLIHKNFGEPLQNIISQLKSIRKDDDYRFRLSTKRSNVLDKRVTRLEDKTSNHADRLNKVEGLVEGATGVKKQIHKND